MIKRNRRSFGIKRHRCAASTLHNLTDWQKLDIMSVTSGHPTNTSSLSLNIYMWQRSVFYFYSSSQSTNLCFPQSSPTYPLAHSRPLLRYSK